MLAVAVLMAYTAMNGLVVPLGRALELVVPGTADIRYGIDIRGGVDAVFEPVDLDGSRQNRSWTLRAIIETRLDNLNILDRDVTVDQQNGFIIVRFPWQSHEDDFDPEKAIAELGETAMLTFQNSAGDVLVTGSHVVEASVGNNPIHRMAAMLYSLNLMKRETELFSEATRELVGQPINIYMDDTLIQSAIVKTIFPTGKPI